jgi:hypothetical protein
LSVHTRTGVADYERLQVADPATIPAHYIAIPADVLLTAFGVQPIGPDPFGNPDWGLGSFEELDNWYVCC